ncbi:MAG: 16S rRNA (cytidine(1402)-2'-O)-methyltransferase [Aestuariivirgaceae bacterium]|nr:16S rRNA (cytidine(1402)-2'-O)-methyltransferase [Aestuariivirgaceae bacterium]
MSSTSPARRYMIGQHGFEAPPLSPGLYLTATPIGNLGDITLRALATLAAADAILCEDTRNTGKLLERYGIRAPLRAYHDHNASKVRPALLEEMKAGKAFALVSDAGTPLINDPGYKLATESVAQGIKVEMLPGASAPVMALALSGLPSDRFLFAGFLPPKSAARRTRLTELASVPATLIFFDTAPRIESTLTDIAAVLPGRTVAVARELTKLYEEVLRGSPENVIETITARGGLKGEITLVIAPPPEDAGQLSPEEIDTRLLDAMKHTSLSQAAAEIAATLGLPKRALYARALALKETGDGEDA